MNITWWQSLLIAIVPAFITAGITLTISLIQTQKTKIEFLNKYQLDRESYIKQKQFDTEFQIFKELSEKTMTMVSDVVSNIFPAGIYYEPSDVTERQQYRIKIYNHCETSFNAAHKAINQYACFISEEWYDKFVYLKQQCAIQIKGYFAFQISDTNSGIKLSEYFERTTKIQTSMLDLIKELRIYINTLTHKGDSENAD